MGILGAAAPSAFQYFFLDAGPPARKRGGGKHLRFQFIGNSSCNRAEVWYNMHMKQTANSISIRKSAGGYLVTVKAGRKTHTFSMLSKNAARSFIRRNYAQTGSYK